MLLWCPACAARHIDEGEFATKEHHTHACQSCGMVWRPAVVPTVGVQFLPGFKEEVGSSISEQCPSRNELGGCIRRRDHDGLHVSSNEWSWT
jgi:hypothetical protein